METQKDWREIFTVETPFDIGMIEASPHVCNANCQLAKELKCVCKCGGRNHGAALKKELRPLDEFGDKTIESAPWSGPTCRGLKMLLAEFG